MTSYFRTIKDDIKSRLETISGIKYVYAYEKGDLGGFPAVTIYSSDSNPSWATTQDDTDIYVYTIHVYQELNGNKTPAEAEELVDIAIENIMAHFQTNYRLGGLVDKLQVSCSKGWTSRELEDRAAVITITTSKLVAI